jgi:pseudaminic acid biosynthesis-associated methylase
MPARNTSDGERLEQLWSGEFGDEYVDRNFSAGEGREQFWRGILDRLEPTTALEVGCNIGGNLQWVSRVLGPESVTGIDINEKALAELGRRLPGVTRVHGRARELPFEDGRFELVYTVGVLIHQSPEDLPLVMDEVVRCSSRYVMCAEYPAEQEPEEEVPYRGHRGALYRRDYGGLYAERNPELSLIEEGSLEEVARYWIFER